jgi:hypothetical protein
MGARCQFAHRIARTAMLSSAAAGMPCLRSCYYCLPPRPTGLEYCLLGGLLLFAFLGSACAGSWLDIESVCSTCCVCDMAAVSAQVREGGGVGEVRTSLAGAS